ncbi:BglG family transcription antiterminator [Alkalibacter saccharofermentans]|uniref:Transcriptional antiterminator n=1 Tax=Alkalibacter saccharofermentans DSM 14828 TaxID=1120975 RepID=A0A1M4SPV4_9FIRM|nr:BglG family transcription antiterminator [Alkalibacter saccharofermentans]SHE34202.1 Transcriptional antiterminator [Alkalibacter saccharofermentans DSM 14828]
MARKKDLNSEILSVLIEEKAPVTVEEIGKIVGRSGKTVRNHLNSLAEFLKEEGMSLVKKPNVGVYLDVNEEQRVKLKSNYGNLKREETYDFRYRKEYILEILLINKFNYTMQMFADELYCSKSTIVNDLEAVEEWLENYSLKLKRKQNQGLWIEGEEIDFRKAIVEFFHDMDKSKNDEIAIDFEELDYRLSIRNFNKLKEFFSDIDLIKVQKSIQNSEKRLGYSFTDQAFLNLLAHIAITIKRVKGNQEIIMPDGYTKNIQGNKAYDIAKELLEELEEAFSLKFPEDETGYICLHMLGAKIQEDITDDNCKEILAVQNELYVKLAKEIIRVTSDILGVDMTKDDVLLTSLVLHIRPIIVRLENGLKLRNPMLETIKNEYTGIFGATWVSGSIFEKECGIMINEDEVAYIAMHIAAAVERSMKTYKTVIVCSSGIGTAQLIKTKLAKRFHNLEIIAVISAEKLSQSLIEQSDIIISTIPYNISSKKVVYVSALLNNEDIFKINRLLGSFNQRQESVLQPSDDDKGYAAEGFIESILIREKKSSTYIGKGLAIPHSKTEFVKKSKIAVIRLKRLMVYKHEMIDTIFILCIKMEGYDMAANVFGQFYEMLDDDSQIAELKKAYTPQKINEVLRRFNYGKIDK